MPHPGDARKIGITTDQLHKLATAHHRSLPALLGENHSPVPTPSPPTPFSLPPDQLDHPQPLRTLSAQIATVQKHLAALLVRLDPPPSTASQPHQYPRGSKPSLITKVACFRPSAPRPKPAAHIIFRVEYGTLP